MVVVARFFALVVSVALVPVANATLSVSPNPNPDGNYTVSWDPHGGTDWYELKQQFNGGGWTTYNVSPTATSKTFSAKPQGTYKYKLIYCAELGHPDEWECFDTGYGTTDVVVQPLPWPDPAGGEQGDYQYETRIGDMNGDSRTDILLDRTTVAESGNGTLDVILLTQLFDGSFSTKVPSASELSVATGWPLAALELNLDDVNIDGFVDVFLGNIDTVIGNIDNLAPGPMNQLVYAPGSVLIEDPKGIRSIDAQFKKFLSELWEWITDVEYFNNNAQWVAGQGGFWTVQWICDGWGWEWNCEWQAVWVPPIPGYWSYDHFDQDAYELSEAIGALTGNLEVEPGSSLSTVIDEILKRVLTTEVYGGVLSGGGLAPWEINIPVGGLGSDRGFTIGVTLLSFSEKVSKPSEGRPLTPGERDLIYENGVIIFPSDLDKVTVYNKKYGFLWGSFVTPNGNIFVNPAGSNMNWKEDYSAAPDNVSSYALYLKGIFVHESVHLWQHYIEQCSKVIKFPGVCRFKWARSDNDYDYVLVPGQNYFLYDSTEHRAEMVSDRWLKWKEHPARKTFNDDVTFEQLDQAIPYVLNP